MAVPGTSEAALRVDGRSGTTLVLNDIVGHIRDASGLGGFLLGLAGFAGDKPRIPRVVKAGIKDTKALRAQLLEWAAIESLTRILVSHGSPIEANPRQALRDLADTL